MKFYVHILLFMLTLVSCKNSLDLDCRILKVEYASTKSNSIYNKQAFLSIHLLLENNTDQTIAYNCIKNGSLNIGDEYLIEKLKLFNGKGYLSSMTADTITFASHLKEDVLILGNSDLIFKINVFDQDCTNFKELYNDLMSENSLNQLIHINNGFQVRSNYFEYQER